MINEKKVIKYWEQNGYYNQAVGGTMPKWVATTAVVLVFIPCDIILSTIKVVKKWVNYLRNY